MAVPLASSRPVALEIGHFELPAPTTPRTHPAAPASCVMSPMPLALVAMAGVAQPSVATVAQSAIVHDKRVSTLPATPKRILGESGILAERAGAYPDLLNSM